MLLYFSDHHIVCCCVQHCYVSVNCVECFTSRLIFEVILSRLRQCGSSADNQRHAAVTGRRRCDNMNDFVHQLRAVFSDRQLCNKCVYIVSLLSCLRKHFSKIAVWCSVMTCNYCFSDFIGINLALLSQDCIYGLCVAVLYTFSHVLFYLLKILERAERLREIDGNILSAFVRLQELVITALCSFVLKFCNRCCCSKCAFNAEVFTE